MNTTALLAVTSVLTLVGSAGPPPLGRPQASADSRHVASELANHLQQSYVDRRAADEIAVRLRRGASAGDFDRVVGDELAKALNVVIRSVTPDPHLGVRYTTEPFVDPGRAAPAPDALERMRRMAAAQNFGFEKAERLPGNVGFMELNGFVDPHMGSDTAVAAMAFLANTEAIIIDLRYNSGGVPGIGLLLSSYFFDRPVHLHSIEWRERDDIRTQQFWTSASVPGRRLTLQPLFILTSNRTISAAESFAYSLQAIGRARIIGEVTAGGGHAGGDVRLTDHFVAFVPTGRAVNPVTKTNWEGTGVRPDVAVDEADAPAVAHRLALERLRDLAVDAMAKAKYQGVLDQLGSSK